MAIEEKQCRRILPRIAVDALDARWCESLCFKYWVGGFFVCGVINTIMTITIIIFTIVITATIITIITNNITSSGHFIGLAGTAAASGIGISGFELSVSGVTIIEIIKTDLIIKGTIIIS